MSTFPGEEDLNAEMSFPLWNPLSNYNVYNLDCCVYDAGVSQYCSTKKLFMDYLDKGEHEALSQVRAAMDARLRWLVVAPPLDQGYPDQVCLPKIGNIYQLIMHNITP